MWSGRAGIRQSAIDRLPNYVIHNKRDQKISHEPVDHSVREELGGYFQRDFIPARPVWLTAIEFFSGNHLLLQSH
jgi:hypothetical protein